MVFQPAGSLPAGFGLARVNSTGDGVWEVTRLPFANEFRTQHETLYALVAAIDLFGIICEAN